MLKAIRGESLKGNTIKLTRLNWGEYTHAGIENIN